ncbi:MAG: hypothetical protein QOH40_506, partial [Arthrobacter pascens]|nr:hypothetical protein [Arthrobacter pascens]
DAPAALAAVDSWADRALAGGSKNSGADQALVRDAVDALLGVKL